MPPNGNEPKTAPAVVRAAAVLRLLSRSDAPMGINAIARALGLVPSTCLHILRALAQEGLVAVDPQSKRYSLGTEILTLARRLLRQNRFTSLVQPLLDALAARHNVTALGITLEEPEHMVVVALARSNAAFSIHVEIGSRLPILLSATGRCYAALADIPGDALRQRFQELRWGKAPSFADWLRQVEEARRLGYAVDAGNNIPGVTVLAAPVLDRSGRMAHAVALLAVSDQLSDGMAAATGDLLRAAGEISARLGAAA